MISYTTDDSNSDSEWRSEIVDGELMSFTIKGLIPNTNYFFKIQAKNIIGSGPFSPTISIKTSPGIIHFFFFIYIIHYVYIQFYFILFFLAGILPFNDGTSIKGIITTTL